ncbi:MAG: hypothetical protein JHC84_05345 [Solirubrobacteraceae bacterium]|nr:hypothetical protein [Solirubrobacteraceae bacterium]
MARLPTPGQDSGVWGDILNDYLSQTHTASGGLKDNTVGASQLQGGSVTSAAIATDAVTGAAVQDGSVTRVKLTGSVQTSLDKADDAIPTSQKGVASGVATLDGSSKLTIAQLPSLVVRESASAPPTTGQYLVKGSDGTVSGGAAIAGALDRNGRVPVNATPFCPIAGPSSPPRSNGANSSATGVTFRQPRVTDGSVADVGIDICQWNQTTNNGADVVPGNGVIVRAAIEYSAVTYPLFFNGVREVTVDAGATRRSDPLPIVLPAGATFYIRIWMNTVNTGELYTTGGSLNGDVTIGLTGSFANGNSVDSTGALGTLSPTASFPLLGAVWGRQLGARRPVYVVTGDSITAGRDDAFSGGTDTTGRRSTGWMTRAADGDFSVINLAMSGGAVLYFKQWEYRKRSSTYLSMATHAVVAHGVNDFATDPSAANLRASLATLWLELANRGLQVIACTITPKTTSTDSWATTGNQTKHANEATRIAVNDWLRDGAALDPATLAPVATGTPGALTIGNDAHPVVALNDNADAVETARNSGIWKVDGTALWYTTDGTHPAAAGHLAMAASMRAVIDAL